MEFRFNINRLLPEKINKIGHNLIPEDFKGDRREFNECQRLLSRILDDIGEASANAQGLNKPVTSASKLRDTDHSVYLMVDSAANNGYGCVIGLLKTGSKNLFLFDENGLHYQLRPRCVLDFYIDKSRQRMGLGNTLYQHMLAEENIRAIKLAIDRPSDKFLKFLRKHYGLDTIIPQNNKFVVFRGFFDDECPEAGSSRYVPPSRSINDGDPRENGGDRSTGNDAPGSASSSYSASSRSGVSRSSYGRYAASRPPCSMANIIHNAAVLGQATGHSGEAPPFSASKLERPRSLSLYSEDERARRPTELSAAPTPVLTDHRRDAFVPEEASAVDEEEKHRSTDSFSSTAPVSASVRSVQRAPSAAFGEHVDRRTSDAQSSSTNFVPESLEKPASIVHSVDAEPSKAPSSLTRHENTPVEKTPSIPNSASSVKASPSCAREAGGNRSAHPDLKFYHSPLW